MTHAGHIARTAGLVITTALCTAAIQNTVWTTEAKFAFTFMVIVIGAFLAAMAADMDGLTQ